VYNSDSSGIIKVLRNRDRKLDTHEFSTLATCFPLLWTSL